MTTRSESIFQNAITLLTQPSLRDHHIDPASYSRASMQLQFAEKLLPGFTQPSAVSVEYNSQTGFTLKQLDSSSAIENYARALSLATGQRVTVNSANNKQIEYQSSKLSIVLPQGYNTFSGMDQMVMLSAESLIRSIYGSYKEKEQLLFYEKPEEILERFGYSEYAKIQDTRFGAKEVQLSNDLSILADPQFHLMIKELERNTDVVRMVIRPAQTGYLKKVYETLGNDFPWNFVAHKTHHQFTLQIDANSDVSTEAIQSLCKKLSVYLGANVSYERASLTKGKFIRVPDSHADAPVSASRTVRIEPYLHSPSVRHNGMTNIVDVQVPFAINNQRIYNYLSQKPSGCSSFICIDEHPNSQKIAATAYKAGIEKLIQELNIEGITFEEKQNELIIKLPTTRQIKDFSSLALLIDMVEVSQHISHKKVSLERNQDQSSINHFFTRELGLERDWNFTETDFNVHLITRQTTLPPLFLHNFISYFQRQIGISRNPEPLRDIQIDAINPIHESRLWDNLKQIADTAAHMLPLAFGNDSIVRLEGNRLTVYCKTLDLPLKYLEMARARLYGIGIPVVFKEDYQATKITSSALLYDVAIHSLPQGAYAHSVEMKGQKCVMTLYNHGADQNELETFQSQIQACSAHPIRFEYKQMSEQLLTLIQEATDLRSKHFFAAAVSPENSVASISALRTLFLDLFEHDISRPASLEVDTARGNFTQKDLTNLNCFSIDSADTKVHEDAFSVQRLDDGTTEFGIHIVNFSKAVPYGSRTDFVAALKGKGGLIEFGAEQIESSLFYTYARKYADLGIDVESNTFSLTFRTDDDHKIIPGSQELHLATIKNKQHLVRSQLEHGTVKHADYDQIAKFCEANATAQFSMISPSMPTTVREVVGTMINLFNYTVADTLLDEGITIPQQAGLSENSRAYEYKATGPVRSYNTLLTQRQLEALLSNSEPLSKEQIEFHQDFQAYPINQSSAYFFLKDLYGLYNSSPNAHIELASDGSLQIKKHSLS